MRLPALPSALGWDHNAHYHDWILRQLPDRIRGNALDVGCGVGTLTRRLVERSERVDAIDRSAAMIAKATAGDPDGSVSWFCGDVLDRTVGLDAAGYAAVIAVSSLHHLPLRAGLARLAELVAPGGTLVAVGLYRPATPTDRLIEAAALPANLVVGAGLALRGRAGKPHDEDMPVRDPEDTIPDLRAAASDLTSGAVVRRRLFWRCSLVWRRPEVP